MTKYYRIQAFAELAGVTVRALHHYDRLGLLQPGRSGQGYRMYREEDLERLEQIVALKFLGMPLRQIREVLDREMALPEALRAQRTVLEGKQAMLARAIAALRHAESSLAAGGRAEPAALKQIIEALDMQQGVEEMKRYFQSEDAWNKGRAYFADWPSPERKRLYADVAAAVDGDPESEQAAALAVRWMKLVAEESQGDPEIRRGMSAAWNDSRYWPEALRERAAEFDLEKLWGFAAKAILALRRKYFDDAAWAEVAGDALFADAGAAFTEGIQTDRAQALAVRWWFVTPEPARKMVLERATALTRERDAPVERLVASFALEIHCRLLGIAGYHRYRKYDELFREVLGADPSNSQEIRARYRRMLEVEGNLLPDAAAREQYWPELLRHHADFGRVTDFLESKAHAF